MGEISKKTGASKGTLSYWLKTIPLTTAEKQMKSAAATRYSTPIKQRAASSKIAELFDVSLLSRSQKGSAAETAVELRLILAGLFPRRSSMIGALDDIVVKVPNGSYVSIQVKCVRPGPPGKGLPCIGLTKQDSHSTRRRYLPDEFDFIVGYDIHTDTAYVFSQAETSKNKVFISVRPDAEERWDKVTSFCREDVLSAP